MGNSGNMASHGLGMWMAHNKRTTVIRTGVFLACIHLVMAAVIELYGGEALMAYLALDFPLVIIFDYFPVVDDLTAGFSALFSVGDASFLVLGTLMYFGIGMLIGWAIWRIKYRKYRECSICSTCGYDLTGNVSGICPECGTPIPKELSDELTTKA
jgi:hypothetical protein